MYGSSLVLCAYASDNAKKRGCAVVNLVAVWRLQCCFSTVSSPTFSVGLAQLRGCKEGPAASPLSEDAQEHQPEAGAADYLLPLLHVLTYCISVWFSSCTMAYKGSLPSPRKSLATPSPPWRTSTSPAVSKWDTAFLYLLFIMITSCLSFSNSVLLAPISL